MQDSGLTEIWVDSGILGNRTIERVLAGKDYSKAVHNITLQALAISFTAASGLYRRTRYTTERKS